MELWLIAQGPAGRARHVAIESPRERPLGDVVAGLARFLQVSPGSPDHPLALYCERLGAWLPNDQPLYSSALRQGDRVVVSPRPSSRTRPPARPVVDLVVVGGPLAGLRAGLAAGEHLVGRGEEDDVRLDEPSVSLAHMRVRVDHGIVFVSDNGSTNGVRVDGEPLALGVERQIAQKEIVEAGRLQLTFEPRAVGREPGLEEEDGWLVFNRPPRRTAPFQPAKVRISAPPPDPSPSRLPLATALLPLVAGGVLWAITKNPATLIFAALSPVMVVGSAIEDFRRGKRGFRRGADEFRRRLAEGRSEVERARDEEASARRAAAPDPAELCGRAERLTPRVWERRPTDRDFLELRVGTAVRESSIEVALENGGSESLRSEANDLIHSARQVPAVPVVAPLRDGALGLSGPPEQVGMLARWLVVQASVLHSPRDLAVLAAVPEEAVDDWSWLKWLPHTRGAGRGERRLAAGPKEARSLVNAAVRLLEQRRAAGSRAGLESRRFTPAFLVVLHEDAVADRATVSQLLADGPAHGITAIWIGEEGEDTPGECLLLAELAKDGSTLAYADLGQAETVDDVSPDGLGIRAARAVARSIAPLRDPGVLGRSSEIPERVSLFETLGVQTVTSADLVSRWRAPHDGLGAPIGFGADGPFTVDLRADGPHGLIGGTSGAGKSELLQAIVAGLAFAHPPNRISFLLVDYKGGAAFRECASLPHTVGLVTDLDEHLSERVLESFRAELRRRERVLREHRASSLLELEEIDPAAAPPSLVIVVDEFATLVAEIPAFVDGIVDVAQRGRSLGLHLVLATQRPRGALNASILANTNLRIALRVTDASESTDVIDVPDAARIPRALPGRAMARTEQGEINEFQSAFASAPTLAVESDSDRVRVMALGFGHVVRARDEDTPTPARSTQLARLVEAARHAVDVTGLEGPAPPWLPPLPESLSLSDARLDAESVPPGGAVLGLLDEPSEQRQRPLTVELVHDGGLLVYGASGSGKTTLLRTLAADLARRHSPDELHLYALDFAARDLGPLADLPHCGGVVTADEPERVLRLFAMLERLAAERRKTPAEGRRASAPPVVVLLDGYAGFAATFERVAGGELLDALQRLVAEGRPLGLCVVITADRRGAVPAAISGRIQRKLVLRMADGDEFAALGVPSRLARRELPPGRGFADGLEVQIAYPGEGPGAESQAEALRSLGERARSRSGTTAPAVTTLSEWLGRDRLPAASGLRVPVGVGETLMEAVSLDLVHGHALVVGPRRSGRTTALETAVLGLLAQPDPPTIVLLAPRRSTLIACSGVASAAHGPAECEEAAARLAAELDARSEADRPLVVVIDDGDELVESGAAGPLLTLVRRGRDVGVRVLAAAERNAAHRAFGNWLRELRNDGQGLLLRPEPDVDGELLGTRLPRGFRRAFPPGRGYLVEGGVAELVQVAAATERPTVSA